jgi:hypothetical protein
MSDWNIRGGFVVSGVFLTAREGQLANEVNAAVAQELQRVSRESWQRGFESGKALYMPRTWLGRFFG